MSLNNLQGTIKMRLMMSCSVQLEQRTQLALLQAVTLVGGATESVFPQTESLLLANTDYQKALSKIAARKKMNRYKSVIDFLLCELFTPFRKHCFAFYRGKGGQLRDYATIEQLSESDNILIKSLEIAHRLWMQDQEKLWAWRAYQKVVHRHIVVEYQLTS